MPNTRLLTGTFVGWVLTVSMGTGKECFETHNSEEVKEYLDRHGKNAVRVQLRFDGDPQSEWYEGTELIEQMDISAKPGPAYRITCKCGSSKLFMGSFNGPPLENYACDTCGPMVVRTVQPTVFC